MTCRWGHRSLGSLVRGAVVIAAVCAQQGCKDDERARERIPRDKLQNRETPEAKGHGQDRECRELKAQFERQKKRGGACTSDEQCLCYPRGLDCGGASDGGTVARLTTLIKVYRLAGCPPPRGCAKRPCAARCVAKRCVAAARADTRTP